MPQPDRVPELMDQSVIEIVAVCESRAERSGIALGVGVSLWISNVMKAPAPGTLSTLLPMTEGAASGKHWNVPAVG